MRFAVIQFPGSNCDQDCVWALRSFPGVEANLVWHKNTSLEGCDAVVVPGGFSYGDYLRCGAIARFSPIMGAVIEHAEAGGLVIGICNGFQILCEARLLPGALVRNRDLHFLCEHVWLQKAAEAPAFTGAIPQGSAGGGAAGAPLLQVPIAHGEGCYFADEETLAELEAENRVVFRYADAFGQVSEASNPNGSCRNIAGIVNRTGNVLGLMPHPERACHEDLGSTDGRWLFQSMIEFHSTSGAPAQA